MKIRNGFVSNSSSSSFVIIGVQYNMDYDELEKICDDKNLDYLSVEQSEYDFVVGKIIADDEELDDTITSMIEIQKIAQEISEKLEVDISEVQLYTGTRPC